MSHKSIWSGLTSKRLGGPEVSIYWFPVRTLLGPPVRIHKSMCTTNGFRENGCVYLEVRRTSVIVRLLRTFAALLYRIHCSEMSFVMWNSTNNHLIDGPKFSVIGRRGEFSGGKTAFAWETTAAMSESHHRNRVTNQVFCRVHKTCGCFRLFYWQMSSPCVVSTVHYLHGQKLPWPAEQARQPAVRFETSMRVQKRSRQIICFWKVM